MNKSYIYQNREAKRIDQYLAEIDNIHSRSYFQNLISKDKILVNGKIIKANYKLKSGDKIVVEYIIFAEKPSLKAEKIDLDIIYEDKNVIVINKQPGLIVHAGAGNNENTLVNALINHFPDIVSAVFDKNSELSRLRPGIVQRLDKDTSGVMIVAKNFKTLEYLTKEIKSRRVKKIYLAFCLGWPKEDKGELVNSLGRDKRNRKKISDVGKEKGKVAISEYQVVDIYKDKEGNKFSLIEFNIKTGRTHQIRYQAKALGNPVIGDIIYGNKLSCKLSKVLGATRQLLHAQKLEIQLPDKDNIMIYEAEIPNDFQRIMDKLISSK